MIIKGAARGRDAADICRLSAHLTNAKSNELVQVVEIRGCASTNLAEALEEMRLLSLGSRTSRAVYHCSINLDRNEAAGMGNGWRTAIEVLETELGLNGHQRAVIMHRKAGRDHIHVAWGRVHPHTLQPVSDSWNYVKHERAARTLEQRLGLRQTIGVHTRPSGAPRPVAKIRHAELQAAVRTGVSIDDVCQAVKAAWAKSYTGQQFAEALAANGYRLAQGRKTIIVIDPVGTPHSVARRLGVKAAVVRHRLACCSLPDGEGVVQLPARERNSLSPICTMRSHQRPRNTRPRPRFDQETISMAQTRFPIVCGLVSTSPDILTPNLMTLLALWRALGRLAEIVGGAVIVQLTDGELHDTGSALTLHTHEVTDQQIRLMIKTGIERGWSRVTFHGDANFQSRAREMALSMGYHADAITTTIPSLAAPPPSPPVPLFANRLGLWRRSRMPQEPEPSTPTM